MAQPVTRIVGHIDHVDARGVSGWAADMKNGRRLTVEIRVDGSLMGTCVADSPRPDLDFVPGESSGRAGFYFPFPSRRRFKVDSYVDVMVNGTVLPETRFYIFPFEGRKVFFMHVPKTGGTTLNSVACRNFSRAIVHLEGTPAWQNVEYISRFQFCSGHIRASDFKKRHEQSGHLMYSMLRNPISQFVSNVSWLRNLARKEKATEFKDLDPAIQDYIKLIGKASVLNARSLVSILREAPPGLVDNQQTRFFLGGLRNLPVDAQALEQAKSTINQLDGVGLTERLDESVGVISTLLGKPLQYEEQVENRGKRWETIILKLRLGRHAEEFIWADQELYDRCIQKFKNKVISH